MDKVETFGGGQVTLTRPDAGLTAVLAEDGQSMTTISPDEVDPAEWAALLEELRRAGLRDGLTIQDEWPTEAEYGQGYWVTTWG